MTQIKLVPLYHSDLFILENVGTKEQIDALVKQIGAEKRSGTETQPRSNEGCWRSSKMWTDIDWLYSRIDELLSTATDYYAKIDNDFKPGAKIEVGQWTNVNEPGARNVFHAHKSAVFSACYYIQAKGTGAIRFTNPENILNDCNHRAPFTRGFPYYPNDRDLLLWPAWMPHEVEPNLSNKQRINMAFDISYKD